MKHYKLSLTEDRLGSKVVREEIMGEWSTAVAESYKADYETFVANNVGSDQWKKLVDLSNWTFTTEDIIPILASHLSWCGEHGLTKGAMVLSKIPESVSVSLMLKQSGMLDRVEFYDNEEAALKFLEET